MDTGRVQIKKDMDVLRLRTLTKKSCLNFGKYKNCTQVGQLIDLDPNYLIWVYFNASKISFVDDVLDDLFITERIEKPGIENDLYMEANNRYWVKIKKELSDNDYYRKFRYMTSSFISTKQKRLVSAMATTGSRYVGGM